MQALLALLSAVALLVWGTHMVRTGFLRVYGANLRRILRMSTGSRLTAMAAGIGVTGLIQSSSATALLTSSFVGQGLINTPAALAVMLGADVGTALMVQVFALNLSWLSPLFLMVGVILAFFLIDRYGRKPLLYFGSVATALALILVGLQLESAHPNGTLVLVGLLGFIAAFAISQGAVIWVFISEIFPNQVRAKGQTLGSLTHWVMAALVAFSFPMLAEKLGGGNTFLFFAVMMVLQLLFVWKLMPETKGKSLEQLEHSIVMH